MTPFDQACRYIDGIPGAISGSGGHAQTFAVAGALVNGFLLSESDALLAIKRYNGKCHPPWSESELSHKVRDAMSSSHEKPPGYLLDEARTHRNAPRSHHTTRTAKAPVMKPQAQKIELDATAVIPEPMEDGTREFIRAAFQPGEGVCICQAKLSEEDSEIPADSGMVFSREEWLEKLDKHKGNINGFLKSKDKCGIYVRVNPMKLGGGKDSDVTAFRHMLLESDSVSLTEQWDFFQKCGLPITTIVHSGGKSIHALIRLDAKDRQEYDSRVKMIYDIYESHELDVKNKNPSRFSRLPGCERFKKRQELLALNVGATSFLAWKSKHEAASLGREIPFAEALAYDPENDETTLLGSRWLCEGGSAMIIGASGIGKSSLSMQAKIQWALGREFFGILPKRPLKSLLIQAENDDGDMFEMILGVKDGMKLTAEEFAICHKNIKIIHNDTATGANFISVVQKLIEIHRPDLVWIDPLLSYVGDDVSKQTTVATFLRSGLIPVIRAGKCALIIANHVNKPPNDKSKARAGFTASDRAYMGTGSADWVNAVRAVVVLDQDAEGEFDLIIAKRARRAGLTEQDGEFWRVVTQTKIRHASQGICWERADKREPKEQPEKQPKKLKTFDAKSFAEWMKGREGNLSKHAVSVLANEWSKLGGSDGVSVSSIKQKFWAEIEPYFDKNGEAFSPKN